MLDLMHKTLKEQIALAKTTTNIDEILFLLYKKDKEINESLSQNENAQEILEEFLLNDREKNIENISLLLSEIN
ncbi:hypothetical protein N5T98_10890 [Aliarcobacter cryaerophilus]|uniref:hypothetical protein n=1 Tax=Aliarcobacter cryaerophilus TaxID=28198 RepID=UPI0021B5A845|nr:hypothetical protein [Aliarcobacter cryaerophilus]MCT7487081.1 hypothetical protein [Aliarcobacter cryaerophilus]MCT7491605.1 hypothetical protein [Aliarcobacter cryaerophilus]